MAYRQIDNSFQYRRPRTPNPTRLDYDRALPPLAEQSLLELRRPNNKNACFSVSALSPNISKSRTGDGNSISGRACLLDRFLVQQAYSSMDGDVHQSPSKPIGQTPQSSGSAFPADSNDLWTILSQLRAQNYIDQPPPLLAIDTSQRVNNQRQVRSPVPSPALSTESAPVSGRSGLRSRAPPDIVTTQHRKSRRYVPQPIYSPALSTESTPVMGHSHQDAPRVDRSQRPSNYVAQPIYTPNLSKGSMLTTDRSRPRPHALSTIGSCRPPPHEPVSPPICPSSLYMSSAPSKQRPSNYASHFGTSQDTSRHYHVTHPPSLSTESAPMTERSRSYIPLARLEGFPIPRAPSLERRTPVPSPLDLTLKQNLRSCKAGCRSPPGSADSESSFTSQSAPGKQSLQTPNPTLNRLATQTRTVRFSGSESPGRSSLGWFPQTEPGFSSPSTTFSFSPVTPVAMTFDYPLIFSTTPTLERVPWDDPVDNAVVHQGSPQKTIVPDTQSPLKEFRGRHNDGGGGGHHAPAGRTRSHSPPKSAFPSESPVYMLPTTLCSPMARKQNSTPTTGLSGWRNDFALHREVAELLVNMSVNHDTGPEPADDDGSVGGLGRTAKWVMYGGPEDERGSFSFGSVASDREAVMRSYFQRL